MTHETDLEALHWAVLCLETRDCFSRRGRGGGPHFTLQAPLGLTFGKLPDFWDCCIILDRLRQIRTGSHSLRPDQASPGQEEAQTPRDLSWLPAA